MVGSNPDNSLHVYKGLWIAYHEINHYALNILMKDILLKFELLSG